MRGRAVSSLMLGALVLAACGSPADDTTAPRATAGVGAGGAPTETTTPDATTTPSIAPTPEPASDVTATPGTAAPDGAAVTETTPAETRPAETDPVEPTEATEPPTPSRPDDGCSADNAPTPTDVADGPVPALDVAAQSADNPLPDLAVRRINCAGGWVNLKNELPADKPLLVWFWAPH